MQALRAVIAVFIPPLGVFLARGLSGAFLINIALTLLGYVPGVIHAMFVVVRH